MSYNGTVVFVDGEFRNYEDVNIGLMNHAFLYGTSCFEAMRGYACKDEVRVLGAPAHFDRLAHSARILRMSLNFSTRELTDAVLALIQRNQYTRDIYIRATLFKSSEQLGVRLHDVADSIAIVAIPFDGYYATSGALRAGVSSWKRVEDNAAPARAKIGGIYINSALAKSEAAANGFDEGITLTEDGHVAEASAANIFIRRGNTLLTPSVTDNILEGITRRIVIDLVRAQGEYTVVERSIDRSELYIADEIFITGTAVGISAIGSIDHRPVGDGTPGVLTKMLQHVFGPDLRAEIPILLPYLDSIEVKPSVAAS